MSKLDSILDKKIIQGGMGVGVSSHHLARTVSSYGQLGVISATAPDLLLIRGLQKGDSSGELREALTHFPNQEIASRIVDDFFIEGGKDPNVRYKSHGNPGIERVGTNQVRLSHQGLENAVVAGAFVEVYLAKKGHNSPIGANFLSKIGWAQLPTLYGAMLAGVDVVLIGAGFPREIPDILTAYENGSIGKMGFPIDTTFNPASAGVNYEIIFDPTRFGAERLERPAFLGIVGNHLGAKALPLADGYVFEGPIAGGHNPPARSKSLNALGEPDYGPKDEMDFTLLASQLEKNSTLHAGRRQPYWLAGNYATRLSEALSHGAQGVQVGTPFSLSQDSGIDASIKDRELNAVMNGAVAFTDPRASPTGFPFKTLKIPGTIAMDDVYLSRQRICDLKYLVSFFENANGSFDSRCPSGPVEGYVKKGGKLEDTVGRKCLCNGLAATIGLGTPGEIELITSGGNFDAVKTLVGKHGLKYSATQVIDYILGI